jgi:uncharacterized repeat protein (TIGR03803 family)
MLYDKTTVKHRLLIGAAIFALFGASSGAHAAGFTPLLSFDGHTGGANPLNSGVVLDSNTGNLFGTTYYGGDGQCGCGVVFQLAPNGTETVLHSFTTGGDGNHPSSGVIRDKKGNLYGVTNTGGANFAGTVFKIAPNGKETLLHSFDTADGATPMGQLVMDKHGNLFGTAYSGGPGTGCCGTVFKIAKSGKFSVLYSFSFGTDGYDNTGFAPKGKLLLDSKNVLYGTAYSGGEIAGLSDGTVFSLTPKGQLTVLHSFGNGTDGADPQGGVIEDSAGNLYGTTVFGGTYGFGAVYKLTRQQGTYSESVLYSFTGMNDGKQPEGDLVLDKSGNLYGTAGDGGDPNDCRCGTVFKLASDGTFTVLHQFTYATDGGFPSAGVIADGGGNLYSTADGGGAGGAGTVFQLPE